MEMILLLVAMFAIMYFLMIRPQQKKMKEDLAMRSQLVEGDRVLLTSGIFGTIAHVGERQMIIELAPGVEITVLKGNVARKVSGDDEEFVFTDDLADDAQPLEEAPAGAELTRENFDTMFDPRGDTTEPTIAAEAPVDEAVTPVDEGYKPWERTDATPADDDEPGSGDTK